MLDFVHVFSFGIKCYIVTVLYVGYFFKQPSTWTKMDKENLAIVTLLENSQEYQDVLHDFVQSAGFHTIVKVYFFFLISHSVLFVMFSFGIFFRLNQL